jgi:hypothetical protein
MAMHQASEPAIKQSFHVRFSPTLFGLEVALHAVVLISIFQLLNFPDLMLFLLLFALLSWKFFKNHPYVKSSNPSCSLMIICHPVVTIRWIELDWQRDYPASEVKILMTRWFILLQLGKGQFKISRILLADSFTSLENYSCCRKNIIETQLC